MNKVILIGRLTRDPEVRYQRARAFRKFLDDYGVFVKEEVVP